MLADRKPELWQIDEAVAAATTGHGGSLVVVSGPIGIGKTALLDEISARARESPAKVLRAGASALERGFSFGLARQLFEPAFAELDAGRLARFLDGVSDFVRSLFNGESTLASASSVPAVVQHVMQAARHLLTVYGEDRPVLLLVDDVQWADLESLRCLGYLANRLAGTGVLLIVSIRDGTQDATPEATGDRDGSHPALRDLLSAGEVLRLRPLSADGIRAMVRHHCGAAGSAAFVRACETVSAGNPLVVRAVLEELAATGTRPDDAAVDRVLGCRPAMLRDRMFARLRGQPAPVMAFLRALACLTSPADVKVVGQLAGLDGIGQVETVRQLTRQGFLRPSRTPEFAHPVLREAVDALTSPAQTERLHTNAAALLYDTGYPPEEVAAHLVAVPAQQGEWAADVLREAAAAAVRRADHPAATRYLRRALLDTPLESRDRAHLLLQLAAVERVGDASASVRHVLEAAALFRDAADRAAALSQLSPVSLGMAPPEVIAAVRATARRLESTPDGRAESELALRLETRELAGGMVGQPALDASVRRLRGLDEAAYLRSPAGRELLAVLLERAAIAGTVPCADVVRLGQRIMAIEAASAELPAAVPTVVSALVAADRGQAAVPWLQVAEAAAARRGDVLARAATGFGQALVLVGAGRTGDAAARASAAIETTGERWYDVLTVGGMLRLGTAMVLPDGLHGPAMVEAELFTRVVELCRPRTDHPVVFALVRLSASATCFDGDELRPALDHLLDCGRQLDRAGWRNPALVAWRTAAAWLQHRLGNTAAALDLAEAEHELAAVWGAPAALGRTLRMRGTITPGVAGIRLLREAVDVLSGSEHELERAAAHLLLGERLRSDSAEEAEVHLRLGRSLVDDGAGRRMAEQNRGQIAGPELTAAERRVVSMVVEGRTNQAVADALGVSRRAVEKHLTSVYAKLNLTGRRELTTTLLAPPGAVS